MGVCMRLYFVGGKCVSGECGCTLAMDEISAEF